MRPLAAVDEIIAGRDTTLLPDSYVSSSTDFVRGLREVVVASAEEIARAARADRDEATRTSLVAVVLTFAGVSLLVALAIVLVVVLVILVLRRRSAVARGARR